MTRAHIADPVSLHPVQSPADDAVLAAARAWRIAIYLPQLGVGGAERAALNLAAELAGLAGQVVLLLDRRGGGLDGTLPPGVRLDCLEAGRTLAAVPRLAAWLRRERPDLLLAYLDFSNVAALAAQAATGVPTRIVTAHHNALSRQIVQPGFNKDRLLPALYRLLLPRAARCIAVSAGVAADLIAVLGRSLPVRTVYNPIVSPRIAEAAAAPLEHPWFADPRRPVVLGVGRLAPQKNFGLLVDAFAALPAELGARLVLLGAGPLQAELQRRIAGHGLAERATILPPDPNPWRYMARARVMALSSDFEGFANVVVEALASGCPVVSTACPYGPSEILEDGKWGRLVAVGDAAGLTVALRDTIRAPLPAELLRQRAAAFSTAISARRYLAVFAEALAEQGEAGRG